MLDAFNGLITEHEVACQLCEEAAELFQAANKLRRLLDGKNPTPKRREEIMEDLLEEAADVSGCLLLLGIGLEEIKAIRSRKLRRWYNRMQNNKKEGNANA